MKKFYNITAICTVIAAITTNCRAQQPDSAILRMMPDMPREITEPAGRAGYLALHYWDRYNFRDTAFLMKDDFLERSFVDYLEILSLIPADATEKSVNTLMKKAEDDRQTFLFILKIGEKYHYEATSPMCDEEKFIPFMRYAMQTSLLEDIEKIRPRFLLESVLTNRKGDMANDFVYTLTNGETGNLHSIEADYTLLYFSDPGCDICLALTKRLIVSPLINDLISQGKLKILTVYTGDEVDLWKQHKPEVLNSWLYSRDAEQKINMEGLYNIKRFPTIYLLDKEKKVLLKDTALGEIENHFGK
ncbi:MAG: DUF5106 domain-containing protein [Tannerella sp.]|nr:DUF5106 domain-containing protein [Tannerella sp.]